VEYQAIEDEVKSERWKEKKEKIKNVENKEEKGRMVAKAKIVATIEIVKKEIVLEKASVLFACLFLFGSPSHIRFLFLELVRV